MRTKKTILNFVTAIILQLITGISGLLVPRMFIAAYGSEVNGMVSSINQFLSFITFFEAGLSGVILSQLYKPLAQNDSRAYNAILADTRNFFNKISVGYVFYVIILAAVYPLIVENDKSYIYISSLVVILSLSLLFQYLFGIVNSIFLQARQDGYIYSILQCVVVILNAVIVIICTSVNTSIHFLKLLAVLASLISPLGLMLYVKIFCKDVDISLKGKSKNINQKSDGMIHHVCYYIQTNVDVMILTFVDLKLVSVYSVYHMITYMIRKVFETFLTSFRSALGDLYARGEIERVKRIFSMLEFIVYTLSVIIYTSGGFLIIPFIKLYTKNITDIEYVNVAFAIILILAEAFYTIRIPYHTLVNCMGCFKQTRGMAIQEAAINIVFSVVFVFFFGIVGVAAGTAISCLFRTIRYYIFFSHNYLYLDMKKILKRVGASLLSAAMCIAVFLLLNFNAENFGIWFLHGIIYVAISSAITVTLNGLFFKEDLKMFLTKIKIIKN